MKLAREPLAVARWALSLAHCIRRTLPRQRSFIFGPPFAPTRQSIQKIFVINLDRDPDRWNRIQQELLRIKDRQGNSLLSLTERHSAVDARSFLQDPERDLDVDPIYTLADQLFVEPQPQTLPTRFDLEAPIRMSRAEIAVARSHIEVWRQIANGNHGHAMILEDDVWFHPGFSRQVDKVWADVEELNKHNDGFDLLYLSYAESKHGAPKALMSEHSFKPVRGLWYLSGYVISQKGAEKLLSLLPCRGPVDLWINQQFSSLNVFAARRVIIRQRGDAISTNSYSILPTLSKIGAINSETAALFNARPDQLPVFAFGPMNSGQSSIAMALSMLGYKCCSDLDDLPHHELNKLRNGSEDRLFNAYVNVGCLAPEIGSLRASYPDAKFILTQSVHDDYNREAKSIVSGLAGADVIVFDSKKADAWRVLCDHLRCAPPQCAFPIVEDQGQRRAVNVHKNSNLAIRSVQAKWDQSPWIIGGGNQAWSGIELAPEVTRHVGERSGVGGNSNLGDLVKCSARTDTFSGNLALFRPENARPVDDGSTEIYVQRERLGVRDFSAGALTSDADFLFGRFEASFRAASVPGVMTGFFLHRNSPHQEIDIEISGNMPSRLIVNVFYNPGGDGAKFDYGYRGSPSYIDLGFDASVKMHQYAIEWSPTEIRWLVDEKLVHRRVLWNPTPIPHLPMKLHFNAWPSRASQLAGRLQFRKLPAVARIEGMRAHKYGQPISAK
ncbi:family 16 glycosylhydrolase [Phaeovulum sp. W22_SRMD_FR3]|uniref:family 16 glycosylhydrolase n=1 Tax=Phaeovulum sp. W22_SRMD_FR3 TaxID=3240274 RepID=UPI003F9558CF